MPDGSGVMLEVLTSPHGPRISNPPAYSKPATAWPRFCGVWQSSHPARVTRYSPYFTRSAGSGLATGVVTGSGTPRIRYFTGKMISVFGNWLWTRGRED